MLRNLRAIHILFFVFVSGCATITPEEITILKTGERLITVCVLNDALFPVAELIISETLNEVFNEYRKSANIVFQREPTQIFYEDVTSQPLEEYATRMWRDCKNIQGIKIVFSNRTLTVAHFPSVKNQDALPESSQLGVASHIWGVALIYSVAEQWHERDLNGSRALITTLKHEIGHCFGLEHMPDKQSFMYAPSLFSFGQWTDEVVMNIKKNYRKIWHAP